MKGIKLQTKKGIYTRRIGKGEILLYDSIGRKVHILNETAYIVWEQCVNNKSCEEIAQILSKRYRMPFEKVKLDTQEILENFFRLGLLTRE